MAGIVHYSNFFRYMEAAEHAFLPRTRVFRWSPGRLTRPLAGLRVRAECDYLSTSSFRG